MSSTAKIVSLSREQLHAMVWNEPLTVVAARFGITGVALRKKCVRHSVPVPGRGYWQQIKAGKPFTPIALPENSGMSSVEFCLLDDLEAAASPQHSAFANGPPPSIAVRTRADYLLEAQQRMEVKKRHLAAIELEQREAHARAAEERKAVEKLEADALAWERAERLRAYIAAVAAVPVAEEAAGDRCRWIKWANGQADVIDPLWLGAPFLPPCGQDVKHCRQNLEGHQGRDLHG